MGTASLATYWLSELALLKAAHVLLGFQDLHPILFGIASALPKISSDPSAATF